MKWNKKLVGFCRTSDFNFSNFVGVGLFWILMVNLSDSVLGSIKTQSAHLWCALEVYGIWFFPLLLCSCVSKIDSCSWYDSWLHKNCRLLLLFNFCHKSRKVQKDIYIPKTLWLKITPAPILFQSKISTPGPALVE